jgi:hypothetical protein
MSRARVVHRDTAANAHADPTGARAQATDLDTWKKKMPRWFNINDCFQPCSTHGYRKENKLLIAYGFRSVHSSDKSLYLVNGILGVQFSAQSGQTKKAAKDRSE